MNILLINSYYYNRGGDCTYTFKLEKLLKSKPDHTVLNFAMKHPLNHPNKHEKYFVPEIDFIRELKRGIIRGGFRVMARSIYSRIAKKQINSLLMDNAVDIAHIQSIRGHITPSIFHTFKKWGIPIIWTLHDFFLVCPNSTFLSHGRSCEACMGKKFYRVVTKKCRKESYAASIVVMLEEYLQRLLGLIKMVDYFIAPSLFLKNKMIEHGLPQKKIKYIPNFIESEKDNQSVEHGDYILYIGRLSYEKGLLTLLKSWVHFPGIKLIIAGDGPIRSELEKTVKELNLESVFFLGRVPNYETSGLIKNSIFIISPSECYENAPYSILEAFVYGKPVIGSRIGGIPELVIDGVTGILFNPGDQADLTDKIRWMLEHPDHRKTFGANAYRIVREKFNPEDHYREVLKVYTRVLKSNPIKWTV